MKLIPHKHNIKTMKQQMSEFDVFSGDIRLKKPTKPNQMNSPKHKKPQQQQRHRKYSCKTCPISKQTFSDTSFLSGMKETSP